MNRQLQPLLLLCPTLVVYAAVTLAPIANVVYLSLQDWSLSKPDERSFSGLENYLWLLSSPAFWSALYVTVLFTVVSVLIEFILGWTVALALNKQQPGVRIVRSILIFPMVIAPIIVALTWKTAYDPDFGLINYVLGLVGIEGPLWIASPATALMSLIMVDVWQWTPFVALVLLSGLQSLPQDVYEAAKIDGASRGATFWFVTIPLMRQVMLIALIFRTMGAFRAYDQIYGLTAGGPGNATTNASFLAYRTTFEQGFVGRGSAVAITLVAVIGVVAFFLLRVFEKRERS